MSQALNGGEKTNAAADEGGGGPDKEVVNKGSYEKVLTQEDLSGREALLDQQRAADTKFRLEERPEQPKSSNIKQSYRTLSDQKQHSRHKSMQKSQSIKKRVQRKGCCDVLTFGWIYPIIQHAKAGNSFDSQTLEEVDVKGGITAYIDRFSSNWRWYESREDIHLQPNALFKCLVGTFWQEVSWLVFLNVLVTVLSLLGPYLVKKLIDYVKTGKCPKEFLWMPMMSFGQPKEYGLMLVGILIFSQGVTYFVQEHISFQQNLKSTLISNALIGIIQRKCLKLSPATNKRFKSGDLITFIQVDVNKLNFLCYQSSGLIKLPLILVVGFWFLYDYLGLVFLVGIGVFFLGFISNMCVSRVNARLQKRYMQCQEERVSLVSECLQNIKTVKMFSWVDVFEQRIQQKRRKELDVQLGKFHLGMIAIAFTFLWPQLMSTLTLSAFVYFGNSLDLSTAYTIKIIFNYVKDPMRMLPIFISQLVEFRLSMFRIQEFLLCDEINPSLTNLHEFDKKIPEKKKGSLAQAQTNSPGFDFNKYMTPKETEQMLKENVAINFRFNGNFHWGIVEDKKEEQDDDGNLFSSSSKKMQPITYPPQDYSDDNDLSINKRSKSVAAEMELDSSNIQSEESLLHEDERGDTGMNSSAKRLMHEINMMQQQTKNLGPPAINESHIQTFNETNQIQPRKESQVSKRAIYKQKKVKDLVTLKDLGLQIKKGEFVCILGDVGSGKSSIISLLIGDLLYLKKDQLNVVKNLPINDYIQERIRQISKEKLSPQRCPIVYSQPTAGQAQNAMHKFDPTGLASYAPQQPWIQNQTIRDNIIFGLPYEKDWYERVIEKCQLVKDFECFPGGDLTELGERGANLSGGQKARISLARAVYADRDVIIMDDPVSALDKNVLKKIFEDLLLKELAGKTRVLVSHCVDYLPVFDKIILLKRGRIIQIGKYQELKGNFFLQRLMKIHKQNKERESQMSMEVIPVAEEKYQSRHELDKLSLDKLDDDEQRREDNKQIASNSHSINESRDEDVDVDEIQDDLELDDPEIDHRDGKRDQNDDEQEAIYIEQVDDRHQILDGDEAMDMDQSNSQKRLLKLQMRRSKVASFLSNDVEQLANRRRTLHSDFQTPQREAERNQLAIQTVPKNREQGDDHASLLNVRQRSRVTARQRLMERRGMSDLERYSIGRMTHQETDYDERVTAQTYKRYVFNYLGGWKFILLSNIAIITFTQAKLYNDYLLGVWSQNTSSDQHEDFYFYSNMIVGFSFLISFFAYLRAGSMQISSWYATRKLHQDMLHSVLNAPVNLYFDRTPLSRILNIFSKDLNQLEIQMAYHMGAFLGLLYQLASIGFVACAAHYYMIVLIPFMVVLCIDLVIKAVPAVIETGKLLRATNSPIFSHVQESMVGASTIRVYGRGNEFVDHNKFLLNQNIKAMQMQQGVQAWFAIRINLLSIVLMAILSSACVLLREDVSQEKQESVSELGLDDDKEVIEPILLSLILSYVLTIQSTLVWVLKYYVQIESNMINAERCMNLANVLQENSIAQKTRLQIEADPTRKENVLEGRENWPEKGFLQFRNVSLRYRPGLDLTLQSLSFRVHVNEKVGIVGRTGAGKSTIGLALSRIVEICRGSIEIDGINIADVPLKELRRRVTLIPQDPVLFTGSLRFNLDPDHDFSDNDLVRVLKKANLLKVLQQDVNGLYQNISEGGQNFSSGERQLICVCRAILRKSKLIILDEATAFIDMITEQNIQELIQREFLDSTMITIAHRLNTILSCDRVMVLSYGELAEFDTPQRLMQDPNSEFNKFLRELEKGEGAEEDEDQIQEK